MTSLPLVRTEHLNVSTGIPRGGATSHGDSQIDVESYLMRHDQVSSSTLHTWGVAEGLSISVTPGSASLTVKPGVALDSAGHLISLAVGGFAITDPNGDPGQVINVPTVPVTADGVVLATTDLTGDRYLTVTWREVIDPSAAGNAPTLIHAPWLRLQPVADVPDTGEQVILAHVVLTDQGAVAALTADHRRVVAIPAGRVELRRTRTSAGPPATVDQLPAGEIRAVDGGGVAVNLLAPNGTVQPVLAADPSGNLALLPSGGAVGVGLRGAAPRRTVHLEGSEVHSGGSGGGFSFSNRTTGSFVENPAAGERWVWYAAGGAARLWSGSDQLVFGADGGGLRLGAGNVGAPLELGANGGSLGKLAFSANTVVARRADGTEPIVIDTVNGRIGQGAAAPTHPLHITGASGIRQNAMYISGGLGWQSLSYNAHHNDTNSGWTFPDPSRPAATMEMYDNPNTGSQVEVYTTTTDNKQGWQLRLGIDGNTGSVKVSGELAAGSLAALASGTLTLQSAGGNVGVGLHGAAARRTVHVEGGEVHSGGPGGGFSFSSRTTGNFVENPMAGERWSWYAAGGAARLWSGSDQLVFGANAGGQRLQIGAAGAPVELSANGGGIGKLALTANTIVARRADGTDPIVVDTVNGRIGQGTATPTHPLHITGVTGIRQNSMYLTGTTTWSSLAYNAYHNDANSGWVFPDPTRPAVAVEMDDNSGKSRFEVWTTTTADKQTLQKRFAIDGDSGIVNIPGQLWVDGPMRVGSTADSTILGRLSLPRGLFVSRQIQAFTNISDTAVHLQNQGGPAMFVSGVPAATFNGDVTVQNGNLTVVGDVDVRGFLSATAKKFVVDHPLDPENRTLAHASVESSELAVMYSGNVECDVSGKATVQLPDWLEALAGNFRYQLTCIGGQSDVYISEELKDNAFSMAGGAAGQRVSWLVTGVRHDSWAREHEMVVEEDKSERERRFQPQP